MTKNPRFILLANCFGRSYVLAELNRIGAEDELPLYSKVCAGTYRVVMDALKRQQDEPPLVEEGRR
jgi:hypothetical protein